MSRRIAIIGGSGALGAGLAKRWARVGHDIIIGSRVADRAAAAAERLNGEAATTTITGHGNLEAAAAGEIVVLTVPYANQMPTLELVAPALDGKILVRRDCAARAAEGPHGTDSRWRLLREGVAGSAWRCRPSGVGLPECSGRPYQRH